MGLSIVCYREIEDMVCKKDTVETYLHICMRWDYAKCRRKALFAMDGCVPKSKNRITMSKACYYVQFESRYGYY